MPNILNISQKHLNTIENSFKSARSIKRFTQPEKRNHHTTHQIKLEQPLSKLLTHLQLTFVLAQQIYEHLSKDTVQLIDLGDDVFNLQEHIAICEQSFDQFCGTYGILVKNCVVQPAVKQQIVNDEIPNEKNVNIAVEANEVFEEGDQEFELYVGGEESDDNVSVGICCDDEGERSNACLLLVLQELKVRLRERQVIRARKLGLTLSENDVIAPHCLCCSVNFI